MKKLVKPIIAAALCAVALFTAVSIIFALKPDVKYFVSDALTPRNSGMPESVSVNNLDEYDAQELMRRGDIETNDSLRLINSDHLCTGEIFDIKEYKTSGVFMNACALKDYADLSAAVSRETGSALYVSSAYRSAQEQESIYDDDTNDVAARPGESEHEAGLGVDLYVNNFAGYGFLKSAAGQFINSHCHEYGFIIRYPAGKKSVTKIKYEPWHVRYVGSPHAEVIYENRLCLEEYIDFFEEGKFYFYEDYTITMQKAPTFKLPKDARNISVSKVFDEFYLITFK